MKNTMHPANHRLVSTNRVAQLLRGLFLGAMILSLAALGQAQSAGTGTITGRVITGPRANICKCHRYVSEPAVSITEFGGTYTSRRSGRRC